MQSIRQLVLSISLCFSCHAASGGFGSQGSPIGGDIPVRGRIGQGLGSFDELMLRVISEGMAPGAALAVVKDGRLVLARGYGWADLERKIPVESDSLFRIASLSKPITAFALLKLQDSGKLRLDDPVMEWIGPRFPSVKAEEMDPGWFRVTLRHLLQHTGGFDRDASFDPMFRSRFIAEAEGGASPAKTDEIIRFMLKRPLDFQPGEAYAYSNFGYCLLGRVIEGASGYASYESFVIKEVFQPLGIKSMRLGKTRMEDRAPGEVVYDTDDGGELFDSVFDGQMEKVPRAYGLWCLETMDAHGGWIASVVDLARFARALDRPGTDSISAASSSLLTQAPRGPVGHREDGSRKDVYYGLGWMVRHLKDGGVNLWHNGALDGTSSLMVRRHDGLIWVVLFNKRSSISTQGQALGNWIDPLLHRAAARVESWPEGTDFFQQAPGGIAR